MSARRSTKTPPAIPDWLRARQEQERRTAERITKWVVPGPDGTPASAHLPDGRLVWQLVAKLARYYFRPQAAAAARQGDLEMLQAVADYFDRHGQAMIGVLSHSVTADSVPALPNYDTLPLALRAALAACLVDEWVEKHEGPWHSYREYDSGGRSSRPQFVSFEEKAVLLPIARHRHRKLRLEHAVTVTDDEVLLLHVFDGWLAKATADDFGNHLAICRRWPGHHFYVCFTYHGWYPVGPKVDAWGA